MSVAEYTSKFEELCRFSRICQGAPETYESWKCIKYQGGLKDDIMTTVAPLEIRMFSELVNKVRVVEDSAKKNFKKDGYTPQHLQGQGNFKKDNNAQFHHMRGSHLCYACGLPGNLAKNCRRRGNQNMSQNQQPGRVFVLDTSEPTESDPPMRGKHIQLL
ncbi:hypothetical protein AHAS_Ahas12G0138500 [Arachis hypogaea]